jgi:peptidoglycan/LPS O-acetylase OafA/YrhL
VDHLKYKPEIDGLRTFAVLSVILYHINPLWLPSGFIGVDIFLVISGFLITNIIIKSNKSRNFGIIDFYSKRIKRIIPLTYFLLIAIMLLGWFLSYPVAYRAESNSVLSALYFIANIRFSLMGSYFNSAEDNPLLHLWSLSMEEQFYFIWPIFIVIFYKFFNEKKLLPIIISLIFISIILSAFFTNKVSLQQYAYFVLPTRMTGLLAGASLALISLNWSKKSNVLSIIGLFLIIFSLFYIDKHKFPSYEILIPLLGCSLIIATPKSTLTKLIFSNKLTSFIGKISFSLYMWHWPLLVFSRRYIESSDINIEYGDTLYLSLYFVILILLSMLSYRYIETFFRKVKLNNTKVFLFIFLLPLFILTTVTLYITKQNGMPMRYGLTDKMTRTETLECHNSLLKDYCYLNQGKGKSILLMGDSHAGSMNHFVMRMAVDQDIIAYDASSGGCDFYSNTFKSTQCESVKNRIDKVLENKSVEYLIIAKRFDGMDVKDVNELMEYIKIQSNNGYKVILFKQVPKLNEREYSKDKYMDKYLSNKMDKQINMKKMDISYRQYNNKIDISLAKNENILLLDLSTVFCEKNLCSILDDNGFPLYYDDDHLSAYGAEWAYERFKNKDEYRKLIKFIN